MICHSNESIRGLVWRQILKAMEVKSRGVRTFEIPDINFEATNIIDVINWQKISLTEPPLTAHLSDDEISQNISTMSLFSIESLGRPQPHASCGETY